VSFITLSFATRITASLRNLGSDLDGYCVCLSWQIKWVKTALGEPAPKLAIWSNSKKLKTPKKFWLLLNIIKILTIS
jgi:hypothetical protein